MIARLAQRLPFYYGWVVVAVAFVTMAIGVNARTAFSLLFPPILDEFHWDRGTIAGAFSFGFLVSGALTPLLGRLSDAKGPRLVVEMGVGFMGLGLLLAPFTSAPWHLYLTLGLLVGGGSVCLSYTGQALYLPNWFVRKRGFAISVAFAGVGVGSILLLPAAQRWIEAFGWRSTCVALGLLLIGVLAPLNLLIRKSPADIGLRPDGDSAPVAGAPARRSNVVDADWVAVDWTLARAVRTARFWWLSLGFFSVLWAWYAVQVHQTKYLVEIGFDARTAAWALGAVSLAGIPGQIILGALSDRIGREWVWTFGCIGFLTTYLVLIALKVAPGAPLLWALILAQGLLGYGVTSVSGAITAEIFEGKQYGAIFGAVTLAGLGGGAIGPWAIGFLYDRTGSYEPGFWLCAAMCVVGVLAVWMAAPRKVRAVAGRMAA